MKNLTDEQRQQFDKALVIIRDKQVEVANLRRMKPGAVIKRIKEAYPTVYDSTCLRVIPPDVGGSPQAPMLLINR